MSRPLRHSLEAPTRADTAELIGMLSRIGVLNKGAAQTYRYSTRKFTRPRRRK
jgi:hypothetical protein